VAPLVVAGLVLLAALTAAVLLGGDGDPPGALSTPGAGQTQDPADPTQAEQQVEAAFDDLVEVLQQGLIEGGIQSQAFRRIAGRVEASFAAYGGGNFELAGREVGKLAGEVDKAVQRNEIDPEWSAPLAERIEALDRALAALTPAETSPAPQTTPAEETTGEEGDD
jgi:hypothetical protein